MSWINRKIFNQSFPLGIPMVSAAVVLAILTVPGQSVFAQEKPEPAIENPQDQDLVPFQWPTLNHDQAINLLTQWAAEKGKSPTQDSDIRNLLERLFESPGEVHARTLEFAASVDPAIEQLLRKVRKRPDADFTESIMTIRCEILRSHLILFQSVRLIKSNLHDEAMEHLNQIDVKTLLDPGVFYFHVGVAHYQLVRLDTAKDALLLVVGHPDSIAERYRSISNMILADIQNNQPDSLNEVSRLMADAGRRQSLDRHTDRVLNQEQRILEKLDKVIANLEKQKQKMKTSASRKGPSPSTPNSKNEPADLAEGGANGKGNVDSKRQSEKGNWGSLPPTEKSIAVTNLVRDLPPHFRTLIEAYFQKLAEEKNE